MNFKTIKKITLFAMVLLLVFATLGCDGEKESNNDDETKDNGDNTNGNTDPISLDQLLEKYKAEVKQDYYNACTSVVQEYFKSGVGHFQITQSVSNGWWTKLEPINSATEFNIYPILKGSETEKVFAYAGEKNNSKFVVSGVNFFHEAHSGKDLFAETTIQKDLINELLGVEDFTSQPITIAHTGTGGSAVRKTSIKAYLEKHNLASNVTFTTNLDDDFDIFISSGPTKEEIDKTFEKEKPIFAFYNNLFGTVTTQSIFDVKLIWGGNAETFLVEEATETCQGSLYKSIEQVETMLDYLVNEKFDVSFDEKDVCTSSVGKVSCDYKKIYDASNISLAELFNQPVNFLKNQIKAYDEKGINIFSEENVDYIKIPLQIADILREEVEYKDYYFREMEDYNEFFQTMYTDLMIHYARPDNVLNNDLGEFSPQESSVQQLETTTINYTANLNKYSNVTATPIYIKAGTTVKIIRNDSLEYNINLYINYQRDGASRIYDNGKKMKDENGNIILNEDGTEKIFGTYNRPYTDRSNVIKIKPSSEIEISSPKGGVVFLELPSFAGGAEVSLTFENVLEGIYLEELTDEKIQNFISKLESSPINWVSIATKEVQLHSSRGKMIQSINDTYSGDTNKFIEDVKEYLIKTLYSYAGFLGEALREHSENVKDYCLQIGATDECANESLNVVSKIQHYYADRASCGSLCSGQPIDQFRALNPISWGEAHEIGHNLQVSRLKIYGGRSDEVSNNIFPVEMYRQVAINKGNDYYNSRYAGESLFNTLKQNINLEPSVNHPVWQSNEYAANNGQRLNFYLQLRFAANDSEMFTKLYLLNRIVSTKLSSAAVWDSVKAGYGFSNYTLDEFKSISSNDFMLIAISKIADRDLTNFFRGFGVSTSAKAQEQVANLNLSKPALLAGMYSLPVDSNGNTPVDFANWGNIDDYYIELTGEYVGFTA